MATGRLASAGCWPIQLSDPFPLIPVPLKSGEPDANLNLKAILDKVYDAAGYDYEIYSDAIVPPLSDDEAAWANEVLNQS